MSWRTVVISKRCKLDLKMGYMVIRGEETRRVFLDEIAVLMIENPAVSMTGCLLEALTEKKVRVIFCDSSRSPVAELVPLHGSHDSTRRIRQQIAWDENTKGALWSMIMADKIGKQAQHLADRKKQREALLLESYIPQIEFQDRTNRESVSASRMIMITIWSDCWTIWSYPENWNGTGFISMSISEVIIRMTKWSPFWLRLCPTSIMCF